MILYILIAATILSIVGVLGLGLFSMAKGGEFNEKYGNKLMRARVALQGIAILLLVLSYFLSQN
tara:strand:+ start:1522 stop:1713 length:192 start_codon:yes stop_codon:yes gene_type:complete